MTKQKRFIELNEQSLETNKIMRDPKREDWKQGRTKTTGSFAINDRTGEHRIGKHVYVGLTSELMRGS